LTTPRLADNSSIIMLTLTDDDDAYSMFIELTPFKTSRDDSETIKEDGMDATGKATKTKKKKKKKKTQIVDSKYPGIPGFTPRNKWEEFIWLLALSERQW
jgi:hypothetical protein